MPSGDIFEVTFQQLLDNEDVHNVYHVEQTTSDPATKTQEEALFDAIAASPIITMHLAPARSTEWALVSIRIYRVFPTRGFPTTTLASLPGTQVGTSLPANMSIVHRLYSSNPTDRGWGRKYWSGIVKGAEADGQLTGTQLAFEQTLADEFLVTLSNDGASWVWGVFSRVNQQSYPLKRTLILSTMHMHRSRTPK